MPFIATNLVAGGNGGLNGYETREVSMEAAAWMRSKPTEFRVRLEEPLDLPFRDEQGVPRFVGYYGPVDSRFGYGGGGITILRALTRLGITAAVSPAYNGAYETAYDVDLPKDAASQLGFRRFIPKWELAQCLPDDFARSNGAAHRVAWTMWEMNKVPDGSKWTKALPFGNWPELINKHSDRLVVPCKHNAEVFAAEGVQVPISVLPYGLDTELWPYVERPERETFTVVLYGDLTDRKGPFEAVIAFQRAFPTEDNVRLVLKTQHGHLGKIQGLPVIPDSRVRVINETWTRPQLLELLASADAFLWPSRGEGFGLPPLQAALTGLPVIMTTHTGMAEYYNPRYFYEIKTAGSSPAPIYGDWLDPDIDSAAEQLRKVYQNRKAASRKGKLAAGYVRKEFSLDAFATRLGAYLETLE